MRRQDDELEWVGGRLSLGRRILRACLVFVVFALPAGLAPGMEVNTRLGWAALGLLIALGVLIIPNRGVFSAPPPVYELIWLVILPVELVALIGVNAWEGGRPAPGLLAGAGDLIGFRFGPTGMSSLPGALHDTHAACLILTLGLTLLCALRILIGRYPWPGDEAWALSFRAGRAVEVSRMKKQKIFGTGALRNVALACGALYFPLKESFATEMIVLPGIIPLEFGIFLLIAMKCGAVAALALLGVAIFKIGLSQGEAAGQAFTGAKQT
ncbi:MAG: hypothetical protein AAGC81_12695 [Pseudomonadota bacterium]